MRPPTKSQTSPSPRISLPSLSCTSCRGLSSPNPSLIKVMRREARHVLRQKRVGLKGTWQRNPSPFSPRMRHNMHAGPCDTSERRVSQRPRASAKRLRVAWEVLQTTGYPKSELPTSLSLYTGTLLASQPRMYWASPATCYQEVWLSKGRRHAGNNTCLCVQHEHGHHTWRGRKPMCLLPVKSHQIKHVRC